MTINVIYSIYKKNKSRRKPFVAFRKMNKSFTSFEKMILTKNFNFIINIKCSYSNIYSIQKLPNSLQIFDCSNNKITSLPELPNKLRILDCSINQLTELPKLSNSLKEFYCNNNRLTSLPELPNKLKKLECYNNKFIKKIKHKYFVKIIYM
jgi:Leucine-rich repeat (LRR) protein